MAFCRRLVSCAPFSMHFVIDWFLLQFSQGILSLVGSCCGFLNAFCHWLVSLAVFSVHFVIDWFLLQFPVSHIIKLTSLSFISHSAHNFFDMMPACLLDLIGPKMTSNIPLTN